MKMLTVFIVIETADVEIVSVRSYRRRKEADHIFDAIQREHSLHEVDDLSTETAGTLRLAGDDSCAVQLFESTEIELNQDAKRAIRRKAVTP